jgi:hypothetical protein
MSSNLTSLSHYRPLPSRPAQCLWAVAVVLLTAAPAKAADAPHSPVSPSQAVTSVDELVKLLTQRELWPPKAEVVEEQLRVLGPWKREQPIPEALTLVAGRSGLVERCEIAYSADEKKRWSFVGATFFVGDADLARLYRALSDQIRTHLGKPRWTRKAGKGERPASGWNLGKRLELSLSDSPVYGESLLAINVSEPQGGPAD